ncbi:MAG: hypothetical protein KC736_00680 [Candidatus Moranbacteria bacterium]|nr:hypothetical protein [Candidatus Moranbacteria bacterium]
MGRKLCQAFERQSSKPLTYMDNSIDKNIVKPHIKKNQNNKCIGKKNYTTPHKILQNIRKKKSLNTPTISSLYTQFTNSQQQQFLFLKKNLPINQQDYTPLHFSENLDSYQTISFVHNCPASI